MISSAARSGSWICQNTTASMSTGTVSLLSACSALNSVVWMRWSSQEATLSMKGRMANMPGPRIAVQLAKPKHDGALPLIRNHDGLGDQEGDDRKTAGDQIVTDRSCFVADPRTPGRSGRDQDCEDDRRLVDTLCNKIAVHDDYSFLREGPDSVSDGERVDPHRHCSSENLFCQTVRLGLLRAGAHGGRGLGDKAAAPANQGNGAHPLQFVIGMANRIEVDLQRDRDFTHRGHLIARRQHAGAELPQDLLPELDIDRDAGAFEPERVE